MIWLSLSIHIPGRSIVAETTEEIAARALLGMAWDVLRGPGELAKVEDPPPAEPDPVRECCLAMINLAVKAGVREGEDLSCAACGQKWAPNGGKFARVAP